MADFVPSFEHSALESDIKRLAVEVEKNREHLESRGANGREMMKHSLQTLSISHPADPVGASATDSPLPDYAVNAPAEAKLEVEYLLDLALHKGIAAAHEEAKKSSPFIQDVFHDAIAGKLYDEFKKRGILE